MTDFLGVRMDDWLLEDPRLDAVEADDLRYGWARFGTADSLRSLLRTWTVTYALSTDQEEFLAVLRRGLSASLADDIRELGAVLSARGYRSYAKTSRAADIFAARYGAGAVGPGRAAIASAFGCSAQRVSQVIAKLLAARPSKRIVSFPAISILNGLQAARADSDDALAATVGLIPEHGHSLLVFRRFCSEVLGLDDPLASVLRLQTLPAVPTDFLRRARLQCAASFAAHLPSIAGEMILESGQVISRNELERIVDGSPGWHWVDRVAGWFAPDEGPEHSLIHRRVREILCVAREPVDAARILTGVLSNPRLTQRGAGVAAAIPITVFVETVRAWPGVHVDGWSRISSSELRPESVLSEAQLKIYQALADRGGVARKGVVLDAIRAATRNTARVLVSQTPWIEAIGCDLYALLGWPISADAFVGAHAAAGPDDVVVVLPRARLDASSQGTGDGGSEGRSSTLSANCGLPGDSATSVLQ